MNKSFDLSSPIELREWSAQWQITIFQCLRPDLLAVYKSRLDTVASIYESEEVKREARKLSNFCTERMKIFAN